MPKNKPEIVKIPPITAHTITNPATTLLFTDFFFILYPLSFYSLFRFHNHRLDD